MALMEWRYSNGFSPSEFSTGDTGTSVAAGKVALVIGSGTANASKIYVLN